MFLPNLCFSGIFDNCTNLITTITDCPYGKERKLCCIPTPGCIDTPCKPHHVECQDGRVEMSRDVVICDSTAPPMTTLLCCNEGYKPPCFNTSCSSGEGGECPDGYEEADRGVGEEWGCPYKGRFVYGKKTCCLTPPKESSEEDDDDDDESGVSSDKSSMVLIVMVWLMGAAYNMH